MVTCTDAHWIGYDITSVVVDKNSLYCPELGTSFEVFGKIGSGVQKKFNLFVTPCNPDTSDRPCAS